MKKKLKDFWIIFESKSEEYVIYGPDGRTHYRSKNLPAMKAVCATRNKFKVVKELAMQDVRE